MVDIESMMQMLLVKVPLDPNLNMHDIAELLAELEASAADVKGICSAACLYAINNVKEGQDLDNVTLKPNDFEEVIGRWKQ
jgi:ATP-dependent 26S proteasome regulatory subunit